MHIKLLRIGNLRVFAQTELRLEPGLNVITGANGAGKTSLLEAVHLLGYGRSFRGGSRDSLIRDGQRELQVFAQWGSERGERRAGLKRGEGEWQARLDGQQLATLSELHQACAVVCFEPGSHALLAGSGEPRRRYLDWALFHVEPAFLPVWRRYQRALRQRNSLLRSGSREDAQFAPWEKEMALTAERIDAFRAAQVASSEQATAPLAAAFLAELGDLRWRYRRGWSRERTFADLLPETRERDQRMGYTFSGPHRADWQLRFEHLPESAPLSRGQEKLAALACVLAQIEVLRAAGSEPPVVLLDDLVSELDREHQRRVWEYLQHASAQVISTGTELPESLPAAWISARFHVERRDGVGEVLRLA